MITNLGDIARAHETFARAHARMLDRSLEEAGRDVVDDVKANAGGGPFAGGGFTTRTGALVRSVKARRLGRGKVLRVTASAKHAKPIEEGSKPHVIAARRKKFLRFTSSMGAAVFARRVNHPGTKPTWFLRSATHRGHAQLEFTLKRRMAVLAAGF